MRGWSELVLDWSELAFDRSARGFRERIVKESRLQTDGFGEEMRSR